VELHINQSLSFFSVDNAFGVRHDYAYLVECFGTVCMPHDVIPHQPIRNRASNKCCPDHSQYKSVLGSGIGYTEISERTSSSAFLPMKTRLLCRRAR